jgi:hypothetical protein
VIHVLEGELVYRRLDPPVEQLLTPAAVGIVRPDQPHEVAPRGKVRFFVEFHAAEPPPRQLHPDPEAAG